MTASPEQLKGHYVVVDEPKAVERLKGEYAEWVDAKRLGRITSSNMIPDPENGAVYFDPDRL